MLSLMAGLVFHAVQNSAQREPSRQTASGTEKRKAKMVVRANWLPMVPMRSLRPSVFCAAMDEGVGQRYGRARRVRDGAAASA